ncbi:universal stress protein [Alienimonas chondri]|uniref:UspA domain-containing protein n=1 Tax=Alienimonas chondri TaxID=2681879 RepID=A0ABX1VBJ4_9PLAN|nr:universal stress protein [Alienimonas chondri]NNJ25480.1 hypothetical protein [Alienimonas chondri]
MTASSASPAPSRVLLATDHSAESQRAAELLARLPFPAPPTVTLLHALAVPSLHSGLGATAVSDGVLARLDAEAEEALTAEAARLAKRGLRTTPVFRRGRPAPTILAEAESMEADLVVAGAVGQSALERLLLGSVSDRVASQAPCSSLVVRPTGWPEEDRPPRLAVAVDETPASRRAVETLAAIDWPEGTTVAVLSVLQTLDNFVPDFTDTIPDLWDDLRATAERRLEEAAAPFEAKGLTVTRDLQTAAHVGESICRQARAHEADLIAVGDHGDSRAMRFLLGSVSQYVLRHSGSSVWICRGPAD